MNKVSIEYLALTNFDIQLILHLGATLLECKLVVWGIHFYYPSTFYNCIQMHVDVWAYLIVNFQSKIQNSLICKLPILNSK